MSTKKLTYEGFNVNIYNISKLISDNQSGNDLKHINFIIGDVCVVVLRKAIINKMLQYT